MVPIVAPKSSQIGKVFNLSIYREFNHSSDVHGSLMEASSLEQCKTDLTLSIFVALYT